MQGVSSFTNSAISSFGIAFVLAFFLIPLNIRIVQKLKLFDTVFVKEPKNVLKPTLGGLAIWFSVFSAIAFCYSLIQTTALVSLVIASLIVLIIGLREDIQELKFYQKLLGQIASAVIVVIVADIRFSSLYDLMGIGEVHISTSYLISIFTIIVITNAYNLIDGIDGLSGSVGLIASLFFGIWFFLNNEIGLASISLALAGALVAFLNYNWAPSKIFMGDTGSLFVGFFLSIGAIAFIDLNYSIRGSEFAFGGSVGTAVAVLIIPLADTLRVFIKRIARGKSPMHPDRTHTHHILLRLGCNHAQATGILVTVNVIFVLLALVLRNLSDTIVIPAIILTALALSTILDSIFRSAIEKRKEELREENRRGKAKGKVVTFEKNAG